MNLNEKYMKPIKGQITMIAHKGGHFENGKLVGGEIIDTETIQNLIVNSASVLMAERMAPGAITGATNPATLVPTPCIGVGPLSNSST